MRTLPTAILAVAAFLSGMALQKRLDRPVLAQDIDPVVLDADKGSRG